MGNFLRRTLAFILGMLFMLVLIVGSIAGVGYWAFKNLSLNDLGVTDDGVTSSGVNIGGMGEWSIEEWVTIIIEAEKDPRGFTFKKLEENGFDFNGFLTSLGIDVTCANQSDLDALKQTSIAMLLGGSGFDEVNFGALLTFLPINPETGKYPVFSDGARNILRNYTVGELGKIDPLTGKERAYSIFRQLKIGSVFTESFDEEIVDGKYVYSSSNKALDLFANVDLAVITDGMENDTGLDIGYQVNEGHLIEVGDMPANEVVASLITGEDADNYENVLSGITFFGEAKFKELFVYEEETASYVFTLEPVLNNVTLGTFMGNDLCLDGEGCPVHQDVSLCDGNFYNDGVLVEMEPVEKKIMKNLYEVTISEFTEGEFELSNIVDGVYLGESFGYSVGEAPLDSEYCQVDCDIVDELHEHNFYFVDAEGKFVGEMYNKLSNQTMVDAINGDLDIEGIIDTTTIGEMLGYEYDEALATWVDGDGVPARVETATDKVLYNLYEKTVDQLNGDLEMSEILSGISFGELMGYEKCSSGANCTVHENASDCNGKWYKGDEQASALYQPLCEEELSALIDGSVEIEDIIGVLYVGELMGHTYVEDGDYWVDGNGDRLNDVNNLVSDIQLSEIFDGTLDMNDKVQNLTLGAVVETGDNSILQLLENTKVKDISSEMNSLEVGELMGYEKGLAPDGVHGFCEPNCSIVEGHVHGASCEPGCAIEENHDHHFYWVDENNEHVSGITSKLDDLTVKELSEGEFENIQFTLGDVIDDDHLNSGVFSLIDNDTNGDGVLDYEDKRDIPTGQISSRITSGVNKSSYMVLVNAGVIDGLEEEEMETLDKLFFEVGNEDEFGNQEFADEVEARAYWTSLSVTALMSETVGRINKLMARLP